MRPPRTARKRPGAAPPFGRPDGTSRTLSRPRSFGSERRATIAYFGEIGRFYAMEIPFKMVMPGQMIFSALQNVGYPTFRM